VLAAAASVNASVVLVDLSPSSGILNQVLLMSCDYMLPPSFADRFSISSATGFLNFILPQWIRAQQERTAAIDEHNEGYPELHIPAEAHPHRYPPFILPFTASAYSGDRERVPVKGVKAYEREVKRQSLVGRPMAEIGQIMQQWNEDWDVDVS
jgi:hypothetical protein